MNINLIKEHTLNVFEKHNLKFYDLFDERIGNQKVLTILFDNNITLEELELIHLEILDLINELHPDGYYLQVASVGAEKELRSFEEVIEQVGEYIYIESPKYTGSATLTEIQDQSLVIKYFIKGRPKTDVIPYSDIKFIRLAVKF